MQSVLITGANGFVGFYLSNQLLQKNYRVIATGKGACRLPFQQDNFIYQSMDFTNEAAVEETFRKFRPQIVVHCGAMSKPDECEMNRESAFLTNVTGTVHLIKAAATTDSFFIFLSTDFVFDGETGMYKENDAREPVNYYGETKLLAEDEVLKYEHDWAIVRTVLVYGKPFLSRQNILTNVASALKEGKMLNIFNDQVRTPTFVEDLASGIVAIIEHKAGGIYHLSGKDVLTPYEMAVAVANYLQLDELLIKKVEEKDFPQPARRPHKTGFNITKARTLLSYDPVSFKEGLERTFG